MASSGSQYPYINPAVPFLGFIEGGLQVGHEVIVKGTVNNSSDDRFSVNFQSGGDGLNIAFHFNPRFDEGGYMVCNTRQDSIWGPEERKMTMPFQKGSPFELCFLVQSSEFQVMLNGKFFLQYSHRVPFHRANAISVIGCVQLSYVDIQVWIQCEGHCLKVAVDGQHLCDYNHRLTDLPAINSLEVGGDVLLTQAQVTETGGIPNPGDEIWGAAVWICSPAPPPYEPPPSSSSPPKSRGCFAGTTSRMALLWLRLFSRPPCRRRKGGLRALA